MILIEEQFEGIVCEATQDGKQLFFQGVIAEAENKNRNGRVYDKGDIEKAATRINEAAKLGRHILGELDHPNSLDVKLENVSHKILEAKMKDHQLIAKAEVLSNHPKGKILESLVSHNINVGFSTRGSGQVNENTGKVTGYNFVTADAVATPSCVSAYPETLREQLEMYKRGEVIEDLSEAVISDPLAQRYFEIEMKKFIQEVFKGG